MRKRIVMMIFMAMVLVLIPALTRPAGSETKAAAVVQYSGCAGCVGRGVQWAGLVEDQCLLEGGSYSFCHYNFYNNSCWYISTYCSGAGMCPQQVIDPYCQNNQ